MTEHPTESKREQNKRDSLLSTDYVRIPLRQVFFDSEIDSVIQVDYPYISK